MRHTCLDIKLCDSVINETRSLRWPVSLTSYSFIDAALTTAFFDENVVEGRDFLQSPPLLATIIETSILSVRLLTRAIELQSLRNQGDDLSSFKTAVNSKAFELPYITALLGKNTGYELSEQMAHFWKKPPIQTMARKKLAQQYRYFSKKYVDGAGTNLPPLAQQFIKHQDLKIAAISSSDKSWSNTVYDESDQLFGNWAATSLIRALELEIQIDEDFKEAIFIQLSNLISNVSSNMNHQWHRFCNSPCLSPGDHLYTGTPKYYTTLLSAHYQNTRRQVTRFSHGGERGLFFDRHWSLTELPYCDRYVFHGKGEAAFIQARLNENPIFLNSALKKPIISSTPSKQHFDILSNAKASQKDNKRKGGRKVLLVCSSIINESQMVYPTFKLNNILTVEFHRWLISALIERGLEVYIKPHPKGAQGQHGNEAYLRDLVTGVVVERLSPEMVKDFDCLIFDFAGSAFMDSLMMGKGIVFIDTGLRPFATGARAMLSNRVSYLKGYQNEDNLLRANVDCLEDMIKKAASQEWIEESEDFALSYFG